MNKINQFALLRASQATYTRKSVKNRTIKTL